MSELWEREDLKAQKHLTGFRCSVKTVLKLRELLTAV
jgi:hypothetical protein